MMLGLRIKSPLPTTRGSGAADRDNPGKAPNFGPFRATSDTRGRPFLRSFPQMAPFGPTVSGPLSWECHSSPVPPTETHPVAK
jgi:hypothetical protein